VDRKLLCVLCVLSLDKATESPTRDLGRRVRSVQYLEGYKKSTLLETRRKIPIDKKARFVWKGYEVTKVNHVKIARPAVIVDFRS
jgi:hypothetical protein